MQKRETILVVDDDRLVLATLGGGLRQAGYEVLEAESGDDAILLARKHQPPLAILDVRMQGKSGMDVARYLATYTDTGFLFLSAFGDRQIVDEAMRLGALGYLVKPLDVKQIVPALEAALARRNEVLRASPQVPPPGTSGPVPQAIYIATGILMERLRLDFERALRALRVQAQTEGCSMEELSTRMLEAANRLNSVTR